MKIACSSDLDFAFGRGAVFHWMKCYWLRFYEWCFMREVECPFMSLRTHRSSSSYRGLYFSLSASYLAARPFIL
jgi:hypothetical protein